MNPVDLVRSALCDEEWELVLQSWREPILEVPDQCPFRRYRLFMVRGGTRQFDFPTLPRGSYTFFVANGRIATRLTRENKEIETILREEWEDLTEVDPVVLSSFVLKFYDAGIKATHHVLRNSTDLEVFAGDPKPLRDYHVTEKELLNVESRIGETNSQRHHDVLTIRAITLCGWMHDKRNLGIELIKIAQNGTVTLATREILSQKIFSKVPAIVY